jgi:hypothetical protein
MTKEADPKKETAWTMMMLKDYNEEKFRISKMM